jgi:hypothetical protein
MDWNQFVSQVVYPALFTALSSFVVLLTKAAAEYLSVKGKDLMHFRGSGVIWDTFIAILGAGGPMLAEALKDGKITSEEKAAINAKVSAVAQEKLKNLYGFYKADLLKWIDEQLEVCWGKLFAGIVGNGGPR